MVLVINAINWLCQIIIYLLLGRAILSWFINPYNANPVSFSYKLFAFVTMVTEPIVRPTRNLLSRFNTGRIDFSIFLSMIIIIVIQRVLTGILSALIV